MNSPIIKHVGINNVSFGENVVVVQPVNIYECNVGSNCFIGPFVEIQKGVVIGRGTKIQSHTFICELVSIGQDCVVAHGVMFINDLFKNGGPAKGDRSLWQITQIGNRVSSGSNATVLPVTICDDVVIVSGAVVTSNINKPGVYAGNPARLLC